MSSKNLTLNNLKAQNIIVSGNIRGGSTTTAGFEANNIGAPTFPPAATTLLTSFPIQTLQGFDFNAGVFTCYVTGRYVIDWEVSGASLTVASTGTTALIIRQNGADQAALEYQFEVNGTSINNRGLSFSRYINLASGDTVSFHAFNATGQNLVLNITRINCVRFSDSTA